MRRSSGCFSFLVRRWSRPVAAVLLLTGCFHYVPAEVPPLPKPETEVRVTLTSALDIPMGEFTLNDVTRIEGIVAEADNDTLGLVAKWLHVRVGRKYDALFGSYNIPVAGIEQLEEWRLSGKRTIVLAGLSVAVVAVFFELARRALSSELPGPPGGDTQSVVAPR